METATANTAVTILTDALRQTLDAAVAGPIEIEVRDSEPATEDLLQELLKTLPLALQVRTAAGVLGLLLSEGDAARLAAGVRETEPSGDRLTDEDRTAIKEVAQDGLSQGLAALAEVSGQGAPAVEETVLEELDENGAQSLAATLGEDGFVTRFTYTGEEDFAAQAALVFSAGIANLSVRETPAAGGEASLSAGEVSDILSGFDVEPPEAAGPGRREAPTNLDMVLDIRLVATARLGKVEVPLGDILNYGPGSIIEVGHMIDEPVELLINDKLIARGDVVVVDEKFGLRITEIVSPKERIESLR